MPSGHHDFAGTFGQEKIESPPPGFDYDRWLGPAPWSPYCKARVHMNWRWNMDYGGGQLMDWVGHHLDIAHWALGFERTGPGRGEGHRRVPARRASTTAATQLLGRRRSTPTARRSSWRAATRRSRAARSGSATTGWVWVDRGGFESQPAHLVQRDRRPEREAALPEPRPLPELRRLRAQPRGDDRAGRGRAPLGERRPPRRHRHRDRADDQVGSRHRDDHRRPGRGAPALARLSRAVPDFRPEARRTMMTPRHSPSVTHGRRVAWLAVAGGPVARAQQRHRRTTPPRRRRRRWTPSSRRWPPTTAGSRPTAVWQLRDYVYARAKTMRPGRAECEAKLLRVPERSPANAGPRKMAASRLLRVIAGDTAVPALQAMAGRPDELGRSTRSTRCRRMHRRRRRARARAEHSGVTRGATEDRPSSRPWASAAAPRRAPAARAACSSRPGAGRAGRRRASAGSAETAAASALGVGVRRRGRRDSRRLLAGVAARSRVTGCSRREDTRRPPIYRARSPPTLRCRRRMRTGGAHRAHLGGRPRAPAVLVRCSAGDDADWRRRRPSPARSVDVIFARRASGRCATAAARAFPTPPRSSCWPRSPATRHAQRAAGRD
ncbi:MAG: hypothetical protein MZW92_40355 [Comamonadaceae bacterium]|nr:hypothetical protein [Comamonadaceae bacterium]